MAMRWAALLVLISVAGCPLRPGEPVVPGEEPGAPPVSEERGADAAPATSE